MHSAPSQNGVDAWDKGAIAAILPTLAGECDVDWNRPLKSWSRDEMIRFLLFAVDLVDKAMKAREVAR
jgi:hypothetical protein